MFIRIIMVSMHKNSRNNQQSADYEPHIVRQKSTHSSIYVRVVGIFSKILVKWYNHYLS